MIGVGTLEYGPGVRAVVWVDDQIAHYYRSLLPKSLGVLPQMHPAHITVVRLNKESPTNNAAWERHADERVDFTYQPVVHTDNTYYWLEVQSQRIGEIRQELGLPQFRQGWDCYHITIGNRKDTG